MVRRNRVDPYGDLHAVEARGLLTGNRGCLVDNNGDVVRHHQRSLWITCLTQYKSWRQPLAAVGRWTPLFFLDDPVALAAGHRPCGLCRRDAYVSYRDAITSASGRRILLVASEIDRRLEAERLDRGRGLVRAADRRLWTATVDELPTGSVILFGHREPHLVIDKCLKPFQFDGWGPPFERPWGSVVDVLTPPTSVTALGHGFEPILHPTARAM